VKINTSIRVSSHIYRTTQSPLFVGENPPFYRSFLFRSFNSRVVSEKTFGCWKRNNLRFSVIFSEADIDFQSGRVQFCLIRLHASYLLSIKDAQQRQVSLQLHGAIDFNPFLPGCL
jgi:hypothetical protein